MVKEWFRRPWESGFRQGSPGNHCRTHPRFLAKTKENQGFRRGTSTAACPAKVKDQKGSRRAMDSTMLVSLSHQVAVYQAMDSIANNIANVSTPAFKRETPTFQEYVEQMQPTESEQGKKKVSFVTETGVVRDQSQGPMETTGNPLDFAINGNGYFAVQTASGERYTRNGHFSLDPNGVLTTDTGDQVETDSGPL